MTHHNHQFWESGALRCILVVEKVPAGYLVQVVNNETPLIYERCATDEEADALAQRFWKLFVLGR